MMIYWNSGANLSNNGASDFLRYGSFTSSTENTTKVVIPKGGVISRLVVKLDTITNTTNPAPGPGNSRTFTVRKNGVDTDLSVTISNNETTGESKYGKVVHVKKFDEITLVHRSSIGITNVAIAIASAIVS